MSERGDIGEFEKLTVGQVARGVKWGRIVLVALCGLAVLVMGVLGFKFETKADARKAHEALTREAAVQHELMRYQRLEFQAMWRQLHRIADKLKAEKVDPPTFDEGEE